MIFTDVQRSRPRGARRAPGHQFLDLLGAARPVPPQGADHARGEPAVGGAGQVRVRRVGEVGVLAEQRVLPRRDAQ
ncbi:hypothetical protein [Streptomyces sp. KL116D]|uniref:hypothetical protein n=1 Tax=Streptomyces sp. KL116D TaxID=3045152 RepID=UPI0035587659